MSREIGNCKLFSKTFRSSVVMVIGSHLKQLNISFEHFDLEMKLASQRYLTWLKLTTFIALL